ncbi:MAG: Fic family protein [Desulfurococcales archaeon]|nr:Fic family protein [Desulfurococcales archaeon]
MAQRRCKVSYPALGIIERAAGLLRDRYPQDPIRWKGGGREQAEQAIAAARWAFHFSKDMPCYARKLIAASVLFYELIMLHPLIDGNKRLATLVLDAFLIRNGLPRPREIYKAALRVAAGEWSQEDVYCWLLRIYSAGRARRRKGG